MKTKIEYKYMNYIESLHSGNVARGAIFIDDLNVNQT